MDGTAARQGSGIEVAVEETYAVRVSGGRIVRVEEYRSKAEALEAVGLSTWTQPPVRD